MLRVREAWDAALAEVPPGEPGGTEALRRRWIAAVLAYGQSAAEGWLTLLAALPEAAAQALGAPAAGAPAAQRPTGPAAGAPAAQQSTGPAPGAPAAQQSTAPAAGAPAAQRPTGPAAGASAAQPPTPALLRSWTAGMPLHTLAELAVSGSELAEVLQKRPGPWLGERLQQLLVAAAAGDIPNDNQSLLQEAKRMDRDEQ
ncbi:CCA-adding enzyme [compost metagenome]